MRKLMTQATLAISFALAGCQSIPTPSADKQAAERGDMVRKVEELTTSFMQQADTLERAAMRMYYAIKSPHDDIADEECAFVADETNRELPLTVYQNIKKLRDMRGLLGLTETKEEWEKFRDMRDSMQWSYQQFARTHAYCQP